jgi:hypothetical protein
MCQIVAAPGAGRRARDGGEPWHPRDDVFGRHPSCLDDAIEASFFYVLITME